MSTEIDNRKETEPVPIVGIIMGSKSDRLVMDEAAEILKQFGVPYSYTIVSAHRTPDGLKAYAEIAEEEGLQVLIAGAGGSAHLPGMLAAYTTHPVIGVPIEGKNLDGLDSLLSIVQMPKGIPVATVAINGAANAALLAVSMLAMNDTELRQKLREYRENMSHEVSRANEDLQKELRNRRQNLK